MKINHPDIGDVLKHVYLDGVVTGVDASNDTVSFTGNGDCPDGADIPIFYHCSADAALRGNGALEGAAGAFSIGDAIIVQCLRENDITPIRTIGFVGKPKSCIWEPWKGPDYNSLHPWTIDLITEDFTSSAYFENTYNVAEESGLLQQVLRVGDYRYTKPTITRDVDTTIRWLSSYNDCKPPVKKPRVLKTLVKYKSFSGIFAWYDLVLLYYSSLSYFLVWVPREGYYDYWIYLHVEDTEGNKINLFFMKGSAAAIDWYDINNPAAGSPDIRFEGKNYDFRTSVGTEVILVLADYGISGDIKEATMHAHIHSEQTKGGLWRPPYILGGATEMSCTLTYDWDYLTFC